MIYQLITEIKLIKEIKFEIIDKENIKNLIERCYSYDANSRPSFQEILKEIIDEQFIESFGANEEEIYQYMKLLKIPENIETVEIDGIYYKV